VRHTLMASWLPLTLLGMSLYAGFNVTMKLAGERTNSLLGAFIVALVGAVTMGLTMLYLRATGEPIDLSQTTTAGIVYSVIGGLCVIGFDVVLYMLFAKQAPLSVVIPIIQIGTIALMTLAGVVWFGETMSMQRVLGLGLAVASVFLLTR